MIKMPRLAGQIFQSLLPLNLILSRSILANSHHQLTHHGLEHLLDPLDDLPDVDRWLVGGDNMAGQNFAGFPHDFWFLHFNLSSNF